MPRLSPFLLFDGHCAETMTFYHLCFGGDLTLFRLGDTPMKENFPVGQHSKITYAQVKSDLVDFSATDWLDPRQAPKPGNTMGMYLSSDQPAELGPLFDKLSERADRKTLVELKEMPFGLYGRQNDRYGVAWFFRGVRATT